MNLISWSFTRLHGLDPCELIPSFFSIADRYARTPESLGKPKEVLAQLRPKAYGSDEPTSPVALPSLSPFTLLSSVTVGTFFLSLLFCCPTSTAISSYSSSCVVVSFLELGLTQHAFTDGLFLVSKSASETPMSHTAPSVSPVLLIYTHIVHICITMNIKYTWI